MTLLTIISYATLITLLSCNFDKQIKDKVESAEKGAKVSMDSDLSDTKGSFSKAYEMLLQRHLDTTLLTESTGIYENINSTTKYIDSLRLEMNKLDNMDTKNVELIRSLYLETGIGDSIMEKLKHSYQILINSTTNDTDKKRLMNIQATFSEETKKNLFQLNSPLGVSMIFFGFESELLKEGTTCFDRR